MKKEINIGIQLYSVRDEIKEYGIDTVFAALKEAGLNTVEFAGFYGLTPAEIKAKCEKYGLRPLASHTGLAVFEEQLPYIDELGIKMVYNPGYPIDKLKDPDGYREFLELTKEAGAKLRERGIRYGYHNHNRELDGEDLLWKMANDLDDYTIELDIYWAVAAGVDPVELIKSYGKKLSALHIKDMDKDADPKSPRELPNAIIGEGQCNAEECFRAAYEGGVDTYILEVEYYPCDYKEYIKRSVDAINGFVERI
jgi:sugar phosphate isomerase/epimerase